MHVVARSGEDSRAVPLERALNRLFDDLERDYIGGRGGQVGEAPERRFLTRAESVIDAFAREHRQDTALGWAHER